MDLISQSTVEFSTALILVLSTILAVFLSTNYFQKKTRAYLFWSVGLWLFAVGVLEEVAFAYGLYSAFLINSYLFIVALIVEFLALGSLQLTKWENVKRAYYLYALVTSVLAAGILSVVRIGDVIETWVVYGNLPLSVIVVSSIITFPAAVIIVSGAAVTYRKTRSYKMLSIIAGVVTVTIAGSLYIVQFPAFLYYSEFAGILLLWAGFFTFQRRKVEKPSMVAPLSKVAG